MIRTIVIILLLAAVGFGGFQLTKSLYDPENGPMFTKEVNVYSSRKEELLKDLFDQFTKETGIRVNFVTDKAGKLIARLEQEGKNSPADVLLTSDVGNLIRAKNKGLLITADSVLLERQIPDQFRDPDGQWFGLTKRVRAIFYRLGDISPQKIATYELLADPAFEGKVLIRSSSNVYNQSLLASLIAHNDVAVAEDWAMGLVKHFARKPQGGDTDQLRALAAGEGEVAIANSYYYGRLLASERPEDKAAAEKIAILFPNQQGRGAHVNISGGGVTAASQNVAEATALLEFLSSDEAQRIYAERNFEFPVVEGVALHPIVDGWGAFKADDRHLATLENFYDEALRIADRAGWR